MVLEISIFLIGIPILTIDANSCVANIMVDHEVKAISVIFNSGVKARFASTTLDAPITKFQMRVFVFEPVTSLCENRDFFKIVKYVMKSERIFIEAAKKRGVIHPKRDGKPVCGRIDGVYA